MQKTEEICVIMCAILPCSMYVMKPRDSRTAPRWKLRPFTSKVSRVRNTQEVKSYLAGIGYNNILTCNSALAVYVTRMAGNVPRLRALVKTSVQSETIFFQFSSQDMLLFL